MENIMSETSQFICKSFTKNNNVFWGPCSTADAGAQRLWANGGAKDKSSTVYLCGRGIIYRSDISKSEAVELEGIMTDVSNATVITAGVGDSGNIIEWVVISNPEHEPVFIPGIRKTPFSPEEWTLQLLRCVSDNRFMWISWDTEEIQFKFRGKMV
jgi:hypothetical protein